MSLRLKLTENNMDQLMTLVRDLDMNPSEVINLIFDNPHIISSARSKDNGKERGKVTCSKCAGKE